MLRQYPTRTGLLAFFDILGYRSFILHSSIQQSARIVETILLPMPSVVRKTVIDKHRDFDRPWAKELEKHMGKPVIISDSIVLDFSIDPSLEGGIQVQWLVFIEACCYLQRQMFDKGLPLRGAISYGEYYIREGCFVGKPVVEAYDVGNKLDLVGCGLTLQAEKELPQGLVGGYDAFAGLLTNYGAPLKGCKPQNMKLLNWAFPGGTLLEPFGEDIRSRVIEAFLKHEKEISSDVYDKVNNTEALLMHCKAAKQTWDAQNPPPKSLKRVS
jgi:hypothetical protein